jgi:hypothetical protein
VEDCSALLDDKGPCSFLKLSVSCDYENHCVINNVPAIGASVGTPGEKYVLVCATTSPARDSAAKVPAKERIVPKMNSKVS